MFEDALKDFVEFNGYDYEYWDWCEEIANKTPIPNLIELHKQIRNRIEERAHEVGQIIKEYKYPNEPYMDFSQHRYEGGQFYFKYSGYETRDNKYFDFPDSALYDDTYVNKLKIIHDEKIAEQQKQKIKLDEHNKVLKMNQYKALQKELGLSDDS